MLNSIKDLPQQVAGIHAVGSINEHDYGTVLIPLLDEKVKEFGRLNYLLILETKDSNFTFAAWKRDFKLMLRYYSKWRKIAIMTDRNRWEWFTDVFWFVIPGRLRHFPLEKMDEAIMWVSRNKK